MVKTLLTQGADVEGRDDGDQTPLKVATKHAQVEVVRVLLEKGANMEARSNSKGIPLNWAVGGDQAIPRSEYADRLAILKFFAGQKGRRRSEDVEWRYASYPGALKYKTTDILQVLLSRGANVEAKDKAGFTALIEATIDDHVDAEPC